MTRRSSSSIDRRQALGSLATAVGVSALPVSALSQARSGTPTPAPSANAAPTMTMHAVPLPARLIAPDGPESTLHRLLPAPGTPVSGGMPPETMLYRLKPAAEARLAIRNDLGQPLALMMRGLRRPSTGSAITGIAQGAEGLLAFPATQPGSFLLTPVAPPGTEGLANEQMARGLTSLVVVEEEQPPAADHDLPVAISDWRVDEQGRLDTGFGDLRDISRMGRLGNRLVVNGRVAPAMLTVRPGARLRLRIANTALARTIPLHVFGAQSRVIAIDSTPCDPFDPLKRNVTLVPGGRCEMMVDMPRTAGEECRIEARFAQNVPLITFRIDGTPLPAHGPILRLPDPGLPPAIRLQDALRVDFAITGGLPREASADLEAIRQRFPDRRRIFRINDGVIGDRPGEAPGQPLFRIGRGKVVVMALRNQTAWPQVIGLGAHAFRLLHPYDDGWEPYFLDTMYLAPGVTARIAFIAETPGRHSLRSTIAEHAEAGVATGFEVT